MSDAGRELPFSPWWLVAAAAVAMGVAGFYQFLWSSIRGPLGARLGVPEPAIGTIFTVFIVCQTTSQFPAGWVRDRYGPRVPLLVAAGCLAAGFGLTAVATDVTTVSLAYALGGVGAGSTFTVAVNTPIKWLDERQGLATGIVSMTYGAVAVVAIPLVRDGLADSFRSTLLVLAAIAGAGVLVAVPVLRDRAAGSGSPADGEATGDPGSSDPTDSPRAAGERPGETSERPDGGAPDGGAPDGGAPAGTRPRDYTWREAARTWQFGVLYVVFVLTNAVSLMIVGKAVSLAGQFGLSAAVATGVASLIALADASGILAGGALADRFGARRTIAVSLGLGGLSLGLAVAAGRAGVGPAFLLLLAGAIFFRSPIFSALPPLLASYYGIANSSTNFALLYTGKLWGGLGAGLLASALTASIGWTWTFLAGAGLFVIAGGLAALLRPVQPTTSPAAK